MKRLLLPLALLPFLALGCKKDSICTQNDSDCDGVPDDLGEAVDRDGVDGPDPWDIDEDGEVDGYAVDTNCDGKPDALGLDTNDDGFVDSIDIDPRGEGDIIGTGSSRANFSCSGGDGDGDGDGDVVVGTGGAVGDGDGDGDGVNPWDEIPEIELGAWYAPVVTAAKDNLGVEYTRWKNQFLHDCGGGRSSVPTDADGLVSEGIGYGMLITASMGSQAEFDAMYATYKIAPKDATGLMQWQYNDPCANSPSGDPNGASDADLDAAMALLQAEARFGGGVYVADAKQLIGTIRAGVVKNCAGKVQLVAGGWDNDCSSLNPSYYSPGYYKAFARVDTLGAGTWENLVNSAYTEWETYKATGPNGLWPDGSGSNCFACNGYDASRVPWRIAMDYAWTGDTRAQGLLTYVSQKVDAQGFAALSTDPNSAFYGALALSGLGVSQAKADSYYATWVGSNPLYDNAYFQGTLRMIYMLVAAGQFPSTLPAE